MWLSPSPTRIPRGSGSSSFLSLLLLSLFLSSFPLTSAALFQCAVNSTTANTATGQISDGPGNYTDSLDCQILIAPSGNTHGVSVTFNFVDTEQGYDIISVYDGSLEDDNALLALYSGTLGPADLPTLYAKHSQILVVFKSDSSTIGTGFSANYTQLTFTPYACTSLSNCQGHGTCNATAQCICNPGYHGADCSQTYSCTGVGNCNSHGICVNTNVCSCGDGWTGTTCNQTISTAACLGTDDNPSFVIMSAPNGTIYSNGTMYATYQNCSFLIQPHAAPLGLVVFVDFLDSEKGSDLLDIYNGPLDDPEFLISESSGNSSVTPFYTNSTSVFVQFTSDSSIEKSGFAIHYYTLSWAPYNCAALNHCSSHGSCNQFATCDCFDTWVGTTCNQQAVCPLRNSCSGQGTCVKNNVCKCHDGWEGANCTLYASSGNCTGVTESLLRNSTGFVTAGPGSFPGGANCTYFVAPVGVVKGIKLEFSEFTLDGWDYVSIYDGVVDDDHLIIYYQEGSDLAPLYLVMSSVIINFQSDYDANPEEVFVLRYTALSIAPYDCTLLNNCTHHGSCLGDSTCSCNPGYHGDRCNMTYSCPSLFNCNGNGLCIATDVCNCTTGYGGTSCAHQLIPNDCTYFSNCNHQGDCTSEGICSCHPGYTSNDCSQVFNCISLSNCSAPNGICVSDGHCQCNDGWTGPKCDQDINECLAHPCQFGGNCTNTIGGYICNCTESQYGQNCEHQLNFQELFLDSVIINSPIVWTAPAGVLEVFVYLWGCGGPSAISLNEACSCSTNKVYCPGGKGGSGGFTAKRVAVVPGAKYYASAATTYYEDTVFYKGTNSSGASLAYAISGDSGWAPTRPSCAGSTCACASLPASNGGGGLGEDDTDVIYFENGCHMSIFDDGCCDGVHYEGYTAGKGACYSASPDSFQKLQGDPGMIVLRPRILQYPLDDRASWFSHYPSLTIKLHDPVSIRLFLVDILGNSAFHPTFAADYALNTTVYILYLGTNTLTTLTPSPVTDPGYNFVAPFSYTLTGTYTVWVTTSGIQIGTNATVIVSNMFLILPSGITETIAMGSSREVPITVANIGLSESHWTATLTPPVLWLSLSGNGETAPIGSVDTISAVYSLDLTTVPTLTQKETSIVISVPGQDDIVIQVVLNPYPGPTDLTLSSFTFDSTVFSTGITQTFRIKTFDKFHFARTTGGDQFAMHVSEVNQDSSLTPIPDTTFRVEYTDLANGEYLCTFTFEGASGHFQLSLYHKIFSTEDLLGAPLSVQILPIDCAYPETPNEAGNQCVCPAAMYRADNNFCSPCEAQTFKNSTGDERCSDCPLNTKSDGLRCTCVEFAILIEGQCKCLAGFDPTSQCSLPCRAGTFSVDGGLACQDCTTDAVSCADGTLKVLPDFWWPATSNFTVSLPFFKCRHGGVCLSARSLFVNATTPPEPTCAEGHDSRSPLCSVCLPGYASSGGDSVCHECWHPAASWVVTILVVLLILLIAWAVVVRSGKGRSTSGVLLRIMINYIQVTFLFSKFKNTGIEVFYNIFSFPTSVGNGFSIDFFPVQCALGWTYFQRWAFYMSLPGAIAVIPILIFALDFKLFKFLGSEISDYVTRYKTLVIALLFLIYSQLGIQVLSMYQCFPVEINGVRPLVASMDIPCYDTPHILGMSFGAIFALLYIVGIPLVGIRLVYKHRTELKTDRIIRSYGFLYNGYETEGLSTYWEFVVLGRKVTLMALLIFVESGYAQNFYASLTLVVALLLQLLVMPYHNSKLNAAESLSLFVNFMTQNLSLLIWDGNSNSLAVSIVIVVGNLLFLVFLIYNICQAIYVERIKEKGLTMKDIPKRAKLLLSQLSFVSSQDLGEKPEEPGSSFFMRSKIASFPEDLSEVDEQKENAVQLRPVSMMKVEGQGEARPLSTRQSVRYSIAANDLKVKPTEETAEGSVY